MTTTNQPGPVAGNAQLLLPLLQLLKHVGEKVRKVVRKRVRQLGADILVNLNVWDTEA